MIETVTFDWWFTMVRLPLSQKEYTGWAKQTRIKGIKQVLAESGRDVSLERLSEAYDLFSKHLEDVWERMLDLSAIEQIAILLQHAGVRNISDPWLLSRLEEPFGRVLLDRPPLLNDGVVECLRTLKDGGYRIGLISNTGRTWGKYLREVQKQYGVFDFFEVLTFSDEVGIRKPHPAIFTRTLEKMHASPATTVHIGDDVNADVKGAKGVGMRAVWYNNGFWPDARTDDADAEINHFNELPAIIRRM